MPVQLSFSIVLRLCQVVTVAFLWHLSAPTHTPHCLFFAPQSYAGKYVPSIAHYIYQMDAIVSGKAQEVDHPRPIPADEIQDPLFKLGGIAIGNGWTGGWARLQCGVQSKGCTHFQAGGTALMGTTGWVGRSLQCGLM